MILPRHRSVWCALEPEWRKSVEPLPPAAQRRASNLACLCCWVQVQENTCGHSWMGSTGWAMQLREYQVDVTIDWSKWGSTGIPCELAVGWFP